MAAAFLKSDVHLKSSFHFSQFLVKIIFQMWAYTEMESIAAVEGALLARFTVFAECIIYSAVQYCCLWLTAALMNHGWGAALAEAPCRLFCFDSLVHLNKPLGPALVNLAPDASSSVKMLRGWFWILCLALPWLFYKNWMSNKMNHPLWGLWLLLLMLWFTVCCRMFTRWHFDGALV